MRHESIQGEDCHRMFFGRRLYVREEKSVKGNILNPRFSPEAEMEVNAQVYDTSRLSQVRKALDALQSLFIFGSLGLVVFGCFLFRQSGLSPGGWWWLWLGGSLMIYNLDRVYPDPADSINLPTRQRLRLARLVIMFFSALALPAGLRMHHGSVLLGVTALAAVASMAYSLPLPVWKKRVKDFAWCKPLYPASIIWGAFFFPTFLETRSHDSPQELVGLAGWSFLALLINLLIFDRRDLIGDLSTGTNTPANLLSTRFYRWLLWACFALHVIFAFLAPRPGPLLGLSVWLAVLIPVSERRRPDWFYAWVVDGMLFIPTLQSWLTGEKIF